MIDEQARRDFEEAWSKGRPDLDAYLPDAGDPRRAATLVELICIDLELAWKSGAATPRVESYGHAFEGAELEELLGEEWRARHRYGDRPGAAEYAARFPALFADAAAAARALGAAPPPLLRSGARVGRYRLEAEHARGGFGLVWRAQDETLGREIALKQLSADAAGDAELRRRFVSEAKITARLEHPGIVPVYDLVESGGPSTLYAMKLVRGVTLDAAIKSYHEGGRAPVERLRLLNTFLAVTRTMAFAHARGVVHRDLKPDNVLLGEYGETVILDWGLAKPIGAAEQGGPVRPPAPEEPQATRVGDVLGTPAFMAPEQVRGAHDEVDARSDVYALGCVLYLMLTGRPPHDGRTSDEVLARRAGAPPPPPRRVAPGVPRPLDAICRHAMAVDRDTRYPDAAALAADLERYLADEAVSCYRESLVERARRWARRHRTLVTVGGAALLLLTVGALVAAKLLGDAQGRTAKALAASRELLYVNGMALADREWRDKNVDRARDLLDECPEDLRGWEWRYARRRCDAFLESFDLGVPFPIRLAVHPGGRRGAVVYRPRALPWGCAFFDLDAGTPALPLPAQHPTTAAAFSPDGRLLATCGGDHDRKNGVVLLRDGATGAVVRRLEHDEPVFYDVAFHPDGTRVAAIGRWKTFVWRVADGARVYDVRSTESGRDPFDSQVRVAWTRDGRHLVTAGGDPKVYAAEDGKLLAELPRDIVLRSLATNDTRVALGGYKSVEGVGQFALYEGAITDAGPPTIYRVNALALDGHRLVTADSDRALRVWDVRSKPRQLFELAGHDGDLFDVVMPPGAGRALAIDGRGTLKVWDVTRDPKVRVIPLASGSSPTAIARDRQGAVVFSGLFELAGRDAATGAVTEPIAWTAGHLHGVVASAGGRHVAAWGSTDPRDVALHLFNRHTGKPRHRLAETLRAIGGAAFSRDGDRIAAATADGKVRVWSCESGKLEAERVLSDDAPFDVAFLPDDRLLVVDAAGALLVTNGALTGDVRRVEAHRGRALAIAVSPDGKTFATGGDDFAIHLWDSTTVRKRATLAGHDQPVKSLDFAPNTPRLASLDAGNELRVWWLGPDREVFSLSSTAPLYSIAWTGNALVAVGREGLYFWDG